MILVSPTKERLVATPANTPTKPYKAVAAFIFTFLGLVIQAINGGDDKFTVNEWIVIIIGSLVTTAAVYGITNPPNARNGGVL